jgi:phospholipid/cholesterol/gamma-HCH transport system substrate-binding protein
MVGEGYRRLAAGARGKRRVPEPASQPTVHGAAAPEAPRHRGRWLAAGALAIALVAVLFLLLTRDTSHTYSFVFDNAGQLVKGDVVRVGGTPAGTVQSIELTSDAKAEVTVTVSDEFAPLHSGTSATIRAQSLIGVANRFVDIQPGPNFNAKLDDGTVLKAENTTSIVELDQLFNSLDPPTRKGLQRTFQGFAQWYAGKEHNANVSAKYFSPLVVSATDLVKEVNRDSATFQDFLVNTADAMGALAERRDDLTNLVGNAGATARAVSVDTESLSQVLTQLPPALRQGSDTFVALRPALDDLQTLAVESKPATKDLAGFLHDLSPVVDESGDVFHQLSAMFNTPGPGNDLNDALRDLPPLATLTETALPRARKSLRDSTPMFSFIRPYAPDLVSFVRGFGSAMAPYDANGHYARAMPVLDAFTFVDDAEGGHLEPKSPSARGRSPFLSLNQLKRCPGSATRPPADGSAPFVDSGPLSNADCDPSQVVRPTQ